MSAADPVAACQTLLLADTATFALVSTRVYGGEIPADAVAEMPQASVLLNPAGGPRNPGGGFQQFGAMRLDTLCYGATPNQAWQVYLAVYQALKQARSQDVDGMLLHSIDVLSKGALGTDPISQWPVCLASFVVLAAETA